MYKWQITLMLDHLEFHSFKARDMTFGAQKDEDYIFFSRFMGANAKGYIEEEVLADTLQEVRKKDAKA